MLPMLQAKLNRSSAGATPCTIYKVGYKRACESPPVLNPPVLVTRLTPAKIR